MKRERRIPRGLKLSLMVSRTFSRFGRGALGVVHAMATASLIGGCDVLFTMDFQPGDYTGDLPCLLTVVDGSGMEGEEEFSSPVEVTVDPGGSITVNGIELQVGAEVVRAIPTAELTLVVTNITRVGNKVTVVYAPMPTLVGIDVTGELVETYNWEGKGIAASAAAELEVTDVEQTVSLEVHCSGKLFPDAETGQ